MTDRWTGGRGGSRTRRPRRGAALVAGLALLALGLIPAGTGAAPLQPPGTRDHAEAQRLLAAGEGEAAVESAYQALLDSDEFSPPDWSQEVPEGNILLDEFTGAASAAYRSRRAAYRVTLGDALVAAGDGEGAAWEYRRAAALDPRPDTWRRLADLPDLPLAERVEFLLRAWAGSGGADREALDLLRASGAFRTGGGLAAALDRFRFRTPGAFRRRPPEGTTPHGEPFPELTLAVSGGAWSSARSFSEERSVLLYFPAPGCPRCGEVVDELQTVLRDRAVDVIAAVADSDLAILTRIAELTGAGLFQPEPQTASARSRLRPRPVGHVARRDTVAFRPPGENEETLWLAARAGLSVWRIPVRAGGSVRRDLQAMFRFLEDSPVPGDGTPLVEIPTDPEALIGTLARLEAGAEPLGDLEDLLLAAVRRELREAGDPAGRALSLLREAAPLRAGDAARLALLARAAPGFGERLLAAARELDASVVRAVPGGRVRVAAGPGQDHDGLLAIQREYEAEDGSSLVLAATLRPGDPGEPGALRALDLRPGRALAVHVREAGFAFLRAPPGDPAVRVLWGPPEGPLREDPEAGLYRGRIVRWRPQLAAGPGDGADEAGGAGGTDRAHGEPRYRVRVDGGPEPPEVVALTEGLDAFAAGQPARAGAAFARAAAALGPGGSLDPAAVRFNLALVQEAEGNREAALAALLALGDATFPAPLEEAIRRLYRTGANR